MRTRTVFVLLAAGLAILSACGPAAAPTPQVVKETVEVPVQQTVVVPVQQTVEVPVQVSAEPQPVTVVRVSMGYIPDMQFAPWYVGVEKGYFANEGIQIILDYSTEMSGVELVSAGEREFGMGTGNSIIQARAQGRPLMFVARWYNGIPSAVFSLKENNITQPQDLVGKTVGTPFASGVNYMSLLATLEANGVDPASVNIQPIGFTQVAAVSEGLVDAAIGYSVNEPIKLKLNGIDVNVIEMSEWSHIVPNGLFANETFVKEHPDVVQAVVRAFLRALKATEEDPAFALEAVIRAVPYSGGDNRAATEESLRKAMEFWTTADGTYGVYDIEGFEWTQDFMLAHGNMDAGTQIDLTQAFTNDFALAAQP